MKFLAWFFAIIVFFTSLTVVTVYNFHQTFFTPESTKKALNETGFYSQMKSVLKKSLFEGDNANSAQTVEISKVLGPAFDQFNFQPKIETLVDDFYAGLKSGNGFMITIDLREYKTFFVNQLQSQSKTEVDLNELTIPDKWNIDLALYSRELKVIGFFYRYYNFIIIGYFVLVALFLFFCLLVSYKYLKLFFTIFLIIGALTFVQYILFAVLDPKTILLAITKQGGSGVDTAVANFINYFRIENRNLLLWESIIPVITSVIGIIIVSVIPSKSSNIPLNNHK